jgi:single-strand DNA-binding protein
MSGNSVTIIGNVTKDPELRFTASGQANTTFGVAVSRRWQNRQTNEWEEQTSFFNVVLWREMAENAAESLTKGSRVIVTGRIEQRSYETQDGDKRNVVEIIADEVGPSLRWATAQVSRSERKGADDSAGGNSGGNSGNSGGGSAPAARPSSGGGQAARPAPQVEPASYYDEEPF